MRGLQTVATAIMLLAGLAAGVRCQGAPLARGRLALEVLGGDPSEPALVTRSAEQLPHGRHLLRLNRREVEANTIARATRW